MKDWIQRFLGTYQLETRIISLRSENSALRDQLVQLQRDIRILSQACGRVIAKIDPMFITPEDDPVRKAASDALGEEVIRKLLGEDHYSNRTL